MEPQDPRSEMAKTLLVIFAFAMVFVGHTSGALSDSDELRETITMAMNIFD